MTTTLILACLALIALVSSVRLQREMKGFELVRRSIGAHGLTCELRRRALVCRAPGDTQEFPHPCEFRVRVLRLAGVPLWCRRQSIALPQQLDAQVDRVRAADFDAHFGGRFRLVDDSHDGGMDSLLNPLHRSVV